MTPSRSPRPHLGGGGRGGMLALAAPPKGEETALRRAPTPLAPRPRDGGRGGRRGEPAEPATLGLSVASAHRSWTSAERRLHDLEDDCVDRTHHLRVGESKDPEAERAELALARSVELLATVVHVAVALLPPGPPRR